MFDGFLLIAAALSVGYIAADLRAALIRLKAAAEAERRPPPTEGAFDMDAGQRVVQVANLRCLRCLDPIGPGELVFTIVQEDRYTAVCQQCAYMISSLDEDEVGAMLREHGGVIAPDGRIS